MTRDGAVAAVEALFDAGGSDAYFGERVTQLQHALQAAQCAQRAQADDELVLAALLHDVGHLLGSENIHAEIGVIDHDKSCVDWLQQHGFSPRVVALVSGHVDAKRYLVATNPDYYQRLSDASRQTLALQGGAMSDQEVAEFESNPHYRDLLRLRSWDEQAKDPEALTQDLWHYRALIARHAHR
ncbi:phosphodiesterase [Bryobacterales bacterium F-183]|nr:phosphodiesterase [Bryobacterales bacterium F-183]